MTISRELLISLERDGVGAILGPGGPEIKNGVLRELNSKPDEAGNPTPKKGGENRQPYTCTDVHADKCANAQKSPADVERDRRFIATDTLPAAILTEVVAAQDARNLAEANQSRDPAAFQRSGLRLVRAFDMAREYLAGKIEEVALIVDGQTIQAKMRVRIDPKFLDELRERGIIATRPPALGDNHTTTGRCRADCDAEVVDGICRLCSRTVDGGALLTLDGEANLRLNELLAEASAIPDEHEDQTQAEKITQGIAIDLAAWAKKLRAGLVGWMRRALAAEKRAGIAVAALADGAPDRGLTAWDCRATLDKMREVTP